MRKVLIVEDNAMLAETYAEILSMEGYHILAIESTGEGAVASAHKHRPEVILMDIALAGAMSGIEAAGEISPRMRVPIVLISGHSDEATRAMVDAIPNASFVMKPVSFPLLASLIEEAIDKAARP